MLRSLARFAAVATIVVLACARMASSAETSTFYRGLNLNGPAVTIDGNRWEGQDSKRYTCKAKSFENQKVKLAPETDADRASMIRSSRWGDVDLSLTEIPNDAYRVWIYVWEDNDSESFTLGVNGREAASYKSGPAGKWDRIGPFRVSVTDGSLRITTQGGAANLSGIEIHRAVRAKPAPEALAFFEQRIRPLLVKHCYECHSGGADQIEGGLRLDVRSGIDTGGYTGAALVPGEPEISLLIKAVRYKDKDLQMPPDGKLADSEIADLETWIKQGAADPREDEHAKPVAKPAPDFWSFQPIAKPSLPALQNGESVANAIDVFIRAKQEAKKVVPIGRADRATLVRRLTFDFTGLPPTPEEIDAFLADDNPDATERLIDRLLAAPSYGEHWGRHWLDIVRYADTAGDNSDYPIPQMYLYRNWVIAALNRDLPYDQFAVQQIAGDLLPVQMQGDASEKERRDHLIATGYLAGAKRFGSYEDERYPWYLTIEDTIDNLGRAYLGLTVNCARCHDHKFDPLTAEDYYALYGFFQSTRYPWPGIELDQRQRDLVSLTGARDAPPKEENRKGAQNDKGRNLSFDGLAYAVAESANKGKQRLGNAAIQIKGDPERPGREVPRRFITALGGQTLPPDESGSGRLHLARWIASSSNPLTARVIVNRLWHYHFGRGIVATPSDFGKQGQRPTHPELLDYMATRLVEGNWSLKAMQRLIASSAVYQLASNAEPANKSATIEMRQANAAGDAENELLWHFRRRRLSAESIRDSILQTAGQLDRAPGTAHPFPSQDKWNYTQHNPFKASYDTNRRSVYMMTQRIQRDPFLSLFDGADTNASTDRRTTSTTSLQALYFLNAPLVQEQSTHAAVRLLRMRDSDAARVELAYREFFGRSANANEQLEAADFLTNAGAVVREHDKQDATVSAWASLVRALWMSNEFVYVN